MTFHCLLLHLLLQVLKREVPRSLAESCQCSDERVMRTLRLLPRSEVPRV